MSRAESEGGRLAFMPLLLLNAVEDMHACWPRRGVLPRPGVPHKAVCFLCMRLVSVPAQEAHRPHQHPSDSLHQPIAALNSRVHGK